MRDLFLLRLYKNKLPQLCLGFACLLFLFVGMIIHIPGVTFSINRLNSLIYDSTLHFFHHGYQEKTRVVIVDIDDISIHKEGRWPWPREKMSTLLLKLKNSGVVVTSFDIILSDSEINYAVGIEQQLQHITNISPTQVVELSGLLKKITQDIDGDTLFANSMHDYDVVLGFLFHHLEDVQNGMLPPPLRDLSGTLLTADSFAAQNFKGYNANLKLFMESAKHGGFVSNLPDDDGVVRQGLLLAGHDNNLYPSFALMTVMRYLLADAVELKFHKNSREKTLYGIEVQGGKFIPTNARGQILIPFWGEAFTLPFYSATDILNDKVDVKELQGAIAIVGSSTTLLSDLHRTPISDSFPGVEMVGNMVAAMLGDEVATRFIWASFHGLAYFSLFGLLLVIIVPFLGAFLRVFCALFLIILILAANSLIFFKLNLFIPSAPLLILIILITITNYLYEFIAEKKQKQYIKQLFGQYVPESYIKELLDSPEKSTMEGKTLDMTVLFSDIRNFTGVSEQLDAVGVKYLLNTVFTPITEIIYNHRGTIDKYVGDMVMAFWGAPIPITGKGHAYHAITASLEIVNELPHINEIMKQNNLPSINMGIGLGTGLMNVGDMGSKFRRAYTVLGDVVNLTSRLEGLTKYYSVNILVNEDTRKNQDDFLWRKIDKVAVKGRAQYLYIYEPMGLLNEMSVNTINEIETYHKALDYYFAQNWELAEELFEYLITQHPDYLLYQLYRRRVANFKLQPPSKDWNGVYTHQEK